LQARYLGQAGKITTNPNGFDSTEIERAKENILQTEHDKFVITHAKTLFPGRGRRSRLVF
jgi:hypothetical protein